MHGPQRVVKTGVQSAGINKIGEAKLPDAAQTLEIRVFNNFENQTRWNGDEPVNGIVEDFFLAQNCVRNESAKMRKGYGF